MSQTEATERTDPTSAPIPDGWTAKRGQVVVEPPVAATTAPDVPRRLRTMWLLAATVACAVLAMTIAGVQMVRAMNGEERFDSLTPVQIGCAGFAALGVVAWTWMVTENARRLLAAGRTVEAPVPGAVAAAWLMPIFVAVAAVSSIAFLERRLNTTGSDTTSAIPLTLILGCLVVAMLVVYRPLFMLSAIMRRLGTSSGDLSRWVWVPISLVVGGALTLAVLRWGGAFGPDFEGVAPAWSLGVVAIPPLVILVALAWRGGRIVEDAVDLAFARRAGTYDAGVGRHGLFLSMLIADARPAIRLDARRRIRLVPGARILRLALMITVAAFTLVSVVGAAVMFLFWREAADGALLASQRSRAWNALAGLRAVERYLLVVKLAVVSIWAFVGVLNVRLASGRRRNPLLAAAAWPLAGFLVWRLAGRIEPESSIGEVVTTYALQIAVLYVPFFLLERSAAALGARRDPLRLTFAVMAILLVHVQGLGGLATVEETSDTAAFGRLAAYLALAALLELIATITVTETSHVVSDAAQSMADKHNFLADQRAILEPTAAPSRPVDSSASSGRPVS